MEYSKGNFIDGQWMKASGYEFSSINPYSEEALWQGHAASISDVQQAVQSAKDAFKKWAYLDINERKNYLRVFERKLKDKKDELAFIISEENGKPYWESLTEVQAMINKVGISINAYDERCRVVEKDFSGAKSIVRFKPHGVVAVFGPFNLPGHLPNGHIIPALLAGNTVIFKPSEQTPLVAEKIIECWQEVNLPKGVINLVQGASDTGIILSQNENIDGLFFTGSCQAGCDIHRNFGGHPEKILALEMGGNNPLIVWDVKDVKAAAYLTVESAFISSGQRCVCARRLIIQDKNSDAFMDVFLSMTRQLKVGYHKDRPEPFMGPMISKKAAKNILDWQRRLKDLGSEVYIESIMIDDHPSLISPGIMDSTAVKNKDDAEIFGPLLQVLRVNDFEEAIDEANNTMFGLSAGLLSDHKDNYEKFFARSRAGVVNWNRQITGASSEAPFGGVGRSGNHNPSAYYAADYCAYPVASIESEKIAMPQNITPGITI